MKEIKFRIIHNNKIVGYEHLTETGWKWNWIELNPDKGERWCKGVIEDSTPKPMLREQYTGLTDKNGKEIYHKDIIGLETINGIIPGWVVEWHDGYGCWALRDIKRESCYPTQIHFWKSHEVIGNIHEHKHLLK